MENSPPSAPASKGSVRFEAGQIWKVGDVNVAVTQVGKTLVHFKRYKAKRPGNPTSMSSILDLQKYLISNKAVLTTE